MGSRRQHLTSKRIARLGFGTAIGTGGHGRGLGGHKHIVAYPEPSVERGRGVSSLSLMATAGFAAAPGMSTAEHDGASAVHQTITCHYHVYTPTTVHVNSGETRCITETSSEATPVATPKSSISEGPPRADGISLEEISLGIEEALGQSRLGARERRLFGFIVN